MGFQSINLTGKQGGDLADSTSPTDEAVRLFSWKSVFF